MFTSLKGSKTRHDKILGNVEEDEEEEEEEEEDEEDKEKENEKKSL